MKILQLNVRSLNTSKYLLKNYVHSNRFDIVCLTETWHHDNGGNMRDILGLIPEWRDRTHKTKGGGVAILVSPNIPAVRRTDLESDELEAIFIETKINNKKCIIASVYLPPDRATSAKINTLNDMLNKINSDRILITGDLNARSLWWEPHSSVPTNNVSWSRGRDLEELCVKHSLEVCNLKEFTRSFFGHQSSPDVTLKRNITGQLRWHVDKNAYLCTDHQPIIINIQEEVLEVKKKYDLKKADWTTWKNKIVDKCSPLCNNLIKGEVCPDEAADQFNNILIETAKETIPTKTVCKHSKQFMTPKLAELGKKCRTLKGLYTRRRDPHNYQLYQQAVQEYSIEYDQAQQHHWEQLCHKISGGGDSDMWKLVNKIMKGSNASIIQPLRNSDGTYEFDDAIISKRLQHVHVIRKSDDPEFDEDWYKHVNDQVNDIIESTRTKLNEDSTPAEWYNKDIAEAEVKNAINNMKPDSAPGPDTILPQMILNAQPGIIRPLKLIFNNSWTKGQVPKIWKSENKIFIPKPGKDDYHTEKAYRGLSLTSIIGKLQERVLKKRLYIYMAGRKWHT